MDDKIDGSRNEGERTASASEEIATAQQDDAAQTSEILETIGSDQKAARTRIIELIGKAQKKAQQGDMNTAFDILSTADIIADYFGDTHAKEIIATGINLLYGITLRTEK